MLNSVQHLIKMGTYETLKQVQGDKLGLFTRPSILGYRETGVGVQVVTDTWHGHVISWAM